MIAIRSAHICCSRLLLTVALAVWSVPPAAAQTKPPSILLFLIDDVGPEHIGIYELGLEPPFADTDELDLWADDWLQFQQAWSTPLCSPTRAAIMTGRHGFRTGVGVVVNDDGDWGLDPQAEPNVLAKLLGDLDPAYATAMFGKYHLGDSPGPGPDCELPAGDCVPDQGGDQAPAVTAGFDHFVVTHLDNQLDPDVYFHYWKSLQGAAQPIEIDTEIAGSDAYLTHATADWFIDWCTQSNCMGASSPPFFAYVAFAAAHGPWHCPPDDVYDDLPPCGAQTLDKVKYYQMIRTLSFEIDRILVALGGSPGTPPANTLIIVAGDNGSPSSFSEAPFNPARAKGTVGEGGVRVPLWIGGEMVNEGEGGVVGGDDFVHLSDLFATVLEVAGGDPTELDPAVDAISLTPYFDDPDPAQPVREFAYVEWFYPNFDPDPLADEGPAIGQWAVRNATHKWVRRTTARRPSTGCRMTWRTERSRTPTCSRRRRRSGSRIRRLRRDSRSLRDAGLLDAGTAEPLRARPARRGVQRGRRLLLEPVPARPAAAGHPHLPGSGGFGRLTSPGWQSV